jgi:tetratricopeptide (TPR) repeat protein
VPARYSRASLHLERGTLDEALAELGEVLRLDPGHVGALVDRGNLLHRLGKLDEALADLGAATEADPGQPTAWYNKGNIHSDRGEWDLAVAAYTKALEIDPRYLPALHNRGQAHARKGDHARALADNQAALAVDPDNARTLNNLAWLWATCPRDDLRDGPRAVEAATRACEQTGWQQPGCLDTLACAYAASGNFAEAVRWQEKALELAAEHEKADYQSRLDLYRAGRPFRDG